MACLLLGRMGDGPIQPLNNPDHMGGDKADEKCGTSGQWYHSGTGRARGRVRRLTPRRLSSRREPLRGRLVDGVFVAAPDGHDVSSRRVDLAVHDTEPLRSFVG